MRRLGIFALLSALVLAAVPATSFAQRGGHGGRGGGWGGGGWGGGGWGGGWGGGYYGGFGYGGRGWGVGVGFGYPGYGYGYGGYGYPYYGYSGYSYPYYGSYSYPAYQPYDYSYSTPPVVAQVPTQAPSTSFYTPSTDNSNASAANLEVKVPANAQIWVEGQPISGNGEVRHFYSPALSDGKTYTYHIRAQWTDPSGKVVDQTRAVDVRAGARTGVDFNRQ